MSTAEAIDLDVEDGVYYPSSDGKPMAETPTHARCMVLLFQALEDYFRDRPEMYIAINMNWYWQKGNPKARRAPDVMVIPDVQPKDRNSFRSWNEGGAIPAVCFEMASKRTWRKSIGPVKDDYEANGVKEYYIFDPRFQFLEDQLLGFRLAKGRYVPIRWEMDGGMISRQLGVRLVPEGELLRVVDLATNEKVLTRKERVDRERARAEQESLRAEQERARARELLDENQRLRAMLRSQGKSSQGEA
jgi:Uma2 family endonuclease